MLVRVRPCLERGRPEAVARDGTEERRTAAAVRRLSHAVIDPDPPGTHHDIALLEDLTGNGLPDIVGKPYHPERHIDLWLQER